MIEITIRQLLRDFKRLLPIPTDGYKVTRRGEEPFYIYPDVRQMSDNGTMPVDTGERKIGVPPYVVLKNPPDTVKFEAGAKWVHEHKRGDRDGEWIWEWCALNDFTHPFEKGVIRKCKRVTVVDSVNDGDAYINGKFYRSQLICEDCLAKIDEKEGITYNEEDI